VRRTPPHARALRFSGVHCTRLASCAAVFFKCKADTKLEKLMRAFCQRQGVAIESVRFLFDGNRIRENQTPNELDMEDGDSIDVVVAQVGGSIRR